MPADGQRFSEVGLHQRRSAAFDGDGRVTGVAADPPFAETTRQTVRYACA